MFADMEFLKMTERVRQLKIGMPYYIDDDEVSTAWSAIRIVRKEQHGAKFGLRTNKSNKLKYIIKIS